MPPAASLPRRPAELYSVTPDGAVDLHFHQGQTRAIGSKRRFVGVFAGSQSGKTSWGPWWLVNEIERCGQGDYLAVTSTYDLFKLKMLPALRDVFENVMKMGRYWAGDKIIELSDPDGRFWARNATDPMWGRIILRSADSGGGLEATTARAAWLDEAGQPRFTIQSWWAVLRRLSLSMGRALVTTTIYNYDWLKTEFYDRWRDGDPEYDVIQFDSISNPAFPKEEWERAKATMPPWQFNMQYRGLFERPAGVIYDCFRDLYVPDGHLCGRFAIPPTWPRIIGLDFGGAHTAGVFHGVNPLTKQVYIYREYLRGNQTAAQHVKNLMEGEHGQITAVGGSWGEGQWRDEFLAGKLRVLRPDVSDVEIGIGRVYAAIKTGEVYVFDDLSGLIGELRSYSRKLDSQGKPTAEIENKSKYHRLDAVRYALGWYRRERKTTEVGPNFLAGYRG